MKAAVRSNWQGTLLTCAKCSKKLGGGFGPDGRDTLARALRKASGGGRKRKAALGVIEVKCLGICPKRAAVLVDAARPERWHLVPPGREVGELLAEMGYAGTRPGADRSAAHAEVERPGTALPPT